VCFRANYYDEKAIHELEKSVSKIKSNKRYRNAKIFLGGDFNLGDINWATGGTIHLAVC
jgi:hypothetical protein